MLLHYFHSMQYLGAFIGFLLFAGTGAMAAPASANAPAVAQVAPVPSYASYSVAMTAYNAVPSQTDGSPLETASGAYSNPQVVAARSQDLGSELPFGTIIEIEGPATKGDTCGYSVVRPIIGYRVIADTMNVRYTNRIDILFPTTANYLIGDGVTLNASNLLGICHGVTIRVVGHVDLSNPANLPKSQAALDALVSGGGLAVR